MSKIAKDFALKKWPVLRAHGGFDVNLHTRLACIQGYEQAEKDIWDRIEKYLKTRHHMDYATVGWILNNLEYYKQKIMEEE